MASIASLGTGSGLDLEGIVTKFMSVEKLPLTALNKREASYQARISSLGSLKGALASLQTAASALTPAIGQTATAKFSTYQARIADSTGLTVVDDDVGVVGSGAVIQMVTNVLVAGGPIAFSSFVFRMT